MSFLPSSLQFGSYLVYSPRGEDKISKRSRNLCSAIKQDGYIQFQPPQPKKKVIPFVVAKLARNVAEHGLDNLFSDQPVLVPVPSSSIKKPNSLNLAQKICEELVKRNLGSSVVEMLERAHSVQKASTAPSGKRPSIDDHCRSLRVADFFPAQSVLLVDDVVTSGTVLLACATRLRQKMPDAKIRAFALVRTMSGSEIDKVIDPCTGKIVPRGTWAYRNP